MTDAPAPARLHVSSAPGGRAVRIVIGGELGDADVARAEGLLAELDQPSIELAVLDLRDLAFVDARVLGLIERLRARARRQRVELVLVRARPAAQRALEFAGVTDRLRFVDNPAHVSRG
jgi:anti-anti-sigma factor